MQYSSPGISLSYKKLVWASPFCGQDSSTSPLGREKIGRILISNLGGCWFRILLSMCCMHWHVPFTFTWPQNPSGSRVLKLLVSIWFCTPPFPEAQWSAKFQDLSLLPVKNLKWMVNSHKFERKMIIHWIILLIIFFSLNLFVDLLIILN